MTRIHSATPPPHHPTTAPRPRRGAAYLLVLAAGMLLSVIGFGILTTSRQASKSAGQAADIDEASVLAESAVENMMAVISSTSNWRSLYTSGVETTPVAFGRGTMSAKLVDETDGVLANNTSDSVRVYGIGKVGSATRIYSVKLTGTGGALEVLSYASHAGGNSNVISGVTATGGPLSSNGTFTVASTGTVTGNVQGVSTSISGTVTGSRTVLPSPKSMPANTVFDTYKALATEIPFSSLATGTMSLKVLSPASNPYGTANGNGVYYIRVPSTGTLTIRQSRIAATLVVELDAGGRITTSNVGAWEPPRTDYPTLIVKGQTGCTVDFNGSTGTLSEVSLLTNFNPSGTPYPYPGGASDIDTADTYPSGMRGVLHVIGTGFTTSFGSNFSITGVAIVEGNAQYGSNAKFTLDPSVASSPPQGYTSTSQMVPSAGSWKWETSP